MYSPRIIRIMQTRSIEEAAKIIVSWGCSEAYNQSFLYASKYGGSHGMNKCAEAIQKEMGLTA